MILQEANQQLVSQLQAIYDKREANAIAGLIMENISGWRKTDRIINKQVPLSPAAVTSLKKYTGELMEGKPVQYVLHEAWFKGMKFYVDERVLIPRPETEELVDWVEEEIRTSKYEVKTILDIGTGSGCIAIALKNKLPGITIYACDTSGPALEVAKQNASAHDAAIHFIHLDFLNNEERNALPLVDLIVSNPPYIPLQDKKDMHVNVVQYEPSSALFVPDDNPLIFYEVMAGFGRGKLTDHGKIFAEIHEALSADARQLFISNGFSALAKKDMHGKDRMIKATLLP
jgi:release factor glutamine methyltransferase